MDAGESPELPRKSHGTSLPRKLAIVLVFLAMVLGTSVWLTRAFVQTPPRPDLAATAIIPAAATPDQSRIGGIVENENHQPIAHVAVSILWVLPASQQTQPGTRVK